MVALVVEIGPHGGQTRMIMTDTAGLDGFSDYFSSRSWQLIGSSGFLGRRAIDIS